jgi:hypothetical protein
MGSKNDVFAGLFFVAIGLLFMLASTNYNMGSASRMGPGYFPALLAGCLMLIGLVVGLRGVKNWSRDSETFEQPISLKSIIFILGGTILFGITLTPLGLFIATAVLVIVSSAAAERAFHWQTLLLAAVLAGFSAVVFVIALGLPIPLWPRI